MNRRQRKARDRRKARNAYFKERAKDAFVHRWSRYMLLQPRKPCRYSGIARYYRLRKELRERVRASQPHRIAEAVKHPLIQYQRQQQGQPLSVFDFEEKYYQELISFWTHWLKGVIDASSFSLGRPALKPVRDLIRLLDDLRTGARTELTEQLLKARKAERRGNKDPRPVAEHKFSVGLCYKLLTEAAFCKQTAAVSIVERCMKNRGLKPLSVSIPDLSRKITESLRYNPENIPVNLRLIARDYGLNQLITNFSSAARGSSVYKTTELGLWIEYLQSKSNDNKLNNKDWKQFMTYFIDVYWESIDHKMRGEILRAWSRAKISSCYVILYFCSPRDELLRFSGYTLDVQKHRLPWE